MVVWGRPDRVNKTTGEIIEREWRDRAGELADDLAAWSLDELASQDKQVLEGLNVQAIESLGKSLCPVCHRPVKWSQALPISLLKAVDTESLGGGYYHITTKYARAGPARVLAPAKIDWRELKKARGDYARVEEFKKMAKQRVKWLLGK